MSLTDLVRKRRDNRCRGKGNLRGTTKRTARLFLFQVHSHRSGLPPFASLQVNQIRLREFRFSQIH